MTHSGILEIALIAVFAPVVVMTTLIIAHAKHADAREKRDALALDQCRGSLIRVLVDGANVAPVDRSLLSGLPARLLLDLFLELERSVRTSETLSLRAVAIEFGVVDSAELLIGSRRWWRRLRGVQLLMLLDERRELRPALLADTHTRIRSTAAAWSVAGATPEEIEAVIHLLDDPDALTRFIATDTLIRTGREAVPAIVELLANREARGVAAALEVASSINDPRFLDPALELCRHEGALIRSLAYRVLGAVGGTRALDQLAVGLADSDERVRAEAAAALGRLRHWPAATLVALCLNDEHWNVRSAAGLALRDMGSPGILLLRRAARPHSPTAPLARQILARRDLFDSDVGAA